MVVMALKTAKSVDQKTRDIVYGFVKRMEKSLWFRNIPTEIYELCLAFYFLPEFFDKARRDCFKISDDKLTVTCIKRCNYNQHTIYMKKWIESTSCCIAKWRFKINDRPSMPTSTSFTFCGLASAYSEIMLVMDFSSRAPNYSLGHGGQRFFNRYPAEDSTTKMPTYKSGDIVTFTLDLDKNIFLCRVNESDDVVVFEDVVQKDDVKYIFVMQLAEKGNSVTLLDFNIDSTVILG